ncbi:MAG: acyl-CoA desaturase [Bacteriovoracia bacterium]
MNFLARALEPPRYGYSREGKLYVPSRPELFREFFRGLNVFGSRKRWLPFLSWLTTLSLAFPLATFLERYFSWTFMLVGFLFAMVVLGSHGTFWLHRYCTHRAYKFRNLFWLQVCRNLVPKIIPEETYVVSHYVHHQFSEQPGDPYNVHGGGWYCFLADVNHQGIRKDLTEAEYTQVSRLLKNSGVRLNSYRQYQRWGTLCHPAWTIAHFALSWAFWYGAYYAVGGHALATCLFGWTGVWSIGVRTYNFDGHGRGKDRRRDGVDFNREDLSVNQIWPGYVSGEWHNNHHLYPYGARSGFLPHQLDLPWLLIRGLAKLGVITSYHDFRDEFLRDHYLPWLEKQKTEKGAIALPELAPTES